MRTDTTSFRRFFLLPACALALGTAACGTTTGTASTILGADATGGGDLGTISGEDSTAAADVPATTDLATTQDIAAPQDTEAAVEPPCAQKSTVKKGTNMRPGEACIACHTQQGEGAYYTIAGTVYATPHAVNGCITTIDYANTTVEVTDANKNVIVLQVNSVGNFYYSKNIPGPYHVRVVKGTDSMEMMKAPSSGDCNSCHTVQGTNNAPGRILSP